MATAFDADAHARLRDRIARLRPEAPARWGRMTAPEMLHHLTDTLRYAHGELAAGPAAGRFRFWPFNWLVIHVVPWPRGKGVSPPAFLRGAAVDWEQERATLLQLLDRLVTRGPRAEWPPDPSFGAISGRSYGVLVYKHFDHHLTQFGA